MYKRQRCFYALSQGRADSKRYPAIDPLESYSKYLEYPEIREYLDDHIEKDWVDLVYAGKTLVQRGKEANDQINILGDDGVPVEYHERFWKSELLDFVILQMCIRDRRRYTDPSTGFISSKSSGGRDLRAQELPGLWNGAMAKWNTVFVDVPITTFSPVKVVQDLLRPQHQ